jgi:hypothetical protein
LRFNDNIDKFYHRHTQVIRPKGRPRRKYAQLLVAAQTGRPNTFTPWVAAVLVKLKYQPQVRILLYALDTGSMVKVTDKRHRADNRRR